MTGREHTPDGKNETSDLRGFDDFDLSLGDIMRGERATKGKSLLDVQRELKIKATYISAIENTDPSAFDTPGFVAGYVRSYARYLGLDPEWAFERFCDEGGFEISRDIRSDARSRSDKAPGVKKTVSSGLPAHERDPFTQPSVSYLPKGEAAMSSLEPKALASIAVLLVLLGGIGYGGWAVLKEVQKVRLTPVEQTPDVLAELDPLSGAAQSQSDVDNEATATAVAESTERVDRIYRPEALDIPVMVARDGPIAAIDPDTVGAWATQDERFIATNDPRAREQKFAVPADLPEPGSDDLALTKLEDGELLPPAVQVVEAAEPTVTLLAVRPSWVRVRAADGTVVFEKILDAGEEFEVPATEVPPTLRAGNANSLYFSINGATYGPVGTGPEVVKGIVMSAEAVRETYSIADATDDTDLARFIAVAEAQGETE